MPDLTACEQQINPRNGLLFSTIPTMTLHPPLAHIHAQLIIKSKALSSAVLKLFGTQKHDPRSQPNRDNPAAYTAAASTCVRAEQVAADAVCVQVEQGQLGRCLRLRTESRAREDRTHSMLSAKPQNTPYPKVQRCVRNIKQMYEI